MPLVQQIFPLPSRSLDELDALAAAYAYPPAAGERAWVRANMVSSLDGAVQGADGRSATVSSPPDRRILSLLRGLADVVLVGAGTARTERYGPAEERAAYAELRRAGGQPPAPPIAVVSRSLDLDPAADLFTAARERTVVLTVDAAPAERRRALAAVADVVVTGDTSIDVPAAVRALADRGLRRVLCEGGPHLLARIVENGCLDELCLTLSPRVVGGRSARMLETPQPLSGDWRLAHLVEDGGTLMSRWLAPNADDA
ncbi:riboflavin-specific deaminase-like protein [Haloactinopolyspora alba]|uniref:Riboflavin-specific deaminase-like protein n=1 Tax=Haloactinopolyspora alba TaxID=648780 RepID=A0A2P8DIJ3_9ACTN|nr:pyrimidine reductase family protein [Haloactinopolyspora alba]PSK96979.1 riboflavin-specific deaminase-like protein [Haloactinopolyspora alba]